MPHVFEENPCIAFGDAAALCGRLWKDMGEEARKPYVKMAKEDKERYAGEMAKLKATGMVPESSVASRGQAAKRSGGTTAAAAASRKARAAKKKEPVKPISAFGL